MPPNSTFTNAGNTTFGGNISFRNEGTVHTTHDDSFDCGGRVIKDQHTFDRQVAEGAFLAAGATCTDPAQYWYSCSCGARGTETFASGGPLGHAWASTSVVPPTETEQGYTIYTCDRCGLTEQRDFVPATGQDDDPGQGEGGAGTGESRPEEAPITTASPERAASKDKPPCRPRASRRRSCPRLRSQAVPSSP